MDGIGVAAALLSAFLHACWNAAVRSQREMQLAMSAQMVVAALLMAPALLVTGLPRWQALPWIAASCALSVSAVRALLRAYAHGPFGVVYPMNRALAVLLVLPMAAALAGEWPGLVPALGVLLVATAVGLLALGRGSGFNRRALGWTLVAALCTASLVMADAQGARAAGHPLAYGVCTSVANAALWSWVHRREHSVREVLAGKGLWALPWAMASATSYALILWAWSRGPIAPAAALRDTSALWAALLAVVFLGERLRAVALVAVGLAVAGTVLIRLG